MGKSTRSVVAIFNGYVKSPEAKYDVVIDYTQKTSRTKHIRGIKSD